MQRPEVILVRCALLATCLQLAAAVTCDQGEPCQFKVSSLPMPFLSMCTCAHDAACNEKTSISGNGFAFSFCPNDQSSSKVCELGELAMRKFGLRIVFKCRCDKPHTMVSREPVSEWTDYYCQQQHPTCSDKASCAIRETHGYRQLCRCPSDKTCKMQTGVVTLDGQADVELGKCM